MFKNFICLASIVFVLFSCQSSINPESVKSDEVKIRKAQAKNTIEGTLKEKFLYELQYSVQVQLIDKEYFYSKHKDEIVQTLKIVETDSIPGTNIFVVFYKYSVGAEVAHETSYMRKLDGNWYLHLGYYASYEDDPFKNGRGEEGKKLLKKIENWKDNDDNIWWK